MLFGFLLFVSGAILEYVRSGWGADAAARGIRKRRSSSRRSRRGSRRPAAPAYGGYGFPQQFREPFFGGFFHPGPIPIGSFWGVPHFGGYGSSSSSAAGYGAPATFGLPSAPAAIGGYGGGFGVPSQSFAAPAFGGASYGAPAFGGFGGQTFGGFGPAQTVGGFGSLGGYGYGF